jgi:23S rRNA (guanine745-N1)-methyltransferase
LATWLRCPSCERDLVSSGSAAWSLSCSAGHAYDANKRGYLALVDRSRGITGDTREILERREAFLRTGHYSPIAGLLDELVPQATAASILDSGCGTGYYLESLLRSRPAWDALALDVSADAVAMAVRSRRAVGVVTDVWRPLPVRSYRADVVLCVFAPRNAEEFARVLTAEGVLGGVTPAEGHLRQLREEGTLIGIQPDKVARLDATLGGRFELVERRSLDYTVGLGDAEVRSLAGMGPSGHHGTPEPRDDRRGASVDVTVAVDASVYRPRTASG